MSADIQYSEVVALTTDPDFIDLYAQHGDMFATYNPSAIGERGWMANAAAALAVIAGDVLISVDERPVDIVPPPGRKLPQELAVNVHEAGAADQAGIIHIQPGTYDDDYYFEVTIAIDGGGDVVDDDVGVSAGDTSVDAATAIAALVMTGVTLTQDADLNDVIVTPTTGGTALTTLTCTLEAGTPPI